MLTPLNRVPPVPAAFYQAPPSRSGSGLFARQTWPGATDFATAWKAPPPPPTDDHGMLADEKFLSMLEGYRVSGGLARTHEVIGMLTSSGRGDIASLAQWMVEGQVISIDWQGQTWFPWFQFQRGTTLPDPQLVEIIRELGPDMEPWETADWFVSANPWLDDELPVDVLASRTSAVLQAARAQHFIARG